jgi:hypothetical protein
MAEPEEITFQTAMPQVGQVTLFTSEEETSLLFTGRKKSDGAPVRSTSLSRSRRVRREEVLRVRVPVAQRLRVVFIEDVSTSETDGKKERTVGPFVGKSFEIERPTEQGALTVYDDAAGGSPASYGVSPGSTAASGAPTAPSSSCPPALSTSGRRPPRSPSRWPPGSRAGRRSPRSSPPRPP